jgi:hypothetical protein
MTSARDALPPALAALLLVPATLAAQTTGTLSVHGPDSPTAAIITGNESTEGGIGTRPVQWNDADVHSLVGQSFLVPGSGETTLNAIFLYLTFYWPPFPDFADPSLSLKIFEGDHTQQGDPIATFSYDATGLPADVTSLNWLRFGLDGGVPVTAGRTYSFLMVFESFDEQHYLSFRRHKNSTGFPDGEELRAGNNYAIDQWATNPWNPDGADNERPRPLGGDLWFHIEGPGAVEDTPPVVTRIEYHDTGDQISLWWEPEAGATYSVNWSPDLAGFSGVVADDVLAGFSGVVADDVGDSETRPYTFASPSANAAKLFFTVRKNP